MNIGAMMLFVFCLSQVNISPAIVVAVTGIITPIHWAVVPDPSVLISIALFSVKFSELAMCHSPNSRDDPMNRNFMLLNLCSIPCSTPLNAISSGITVAIGIIMNAAISAW